MILTYLFFLFLHPYHVSVCDIVYADDEKSLQVTHRIFVDDLQLAVSGYAETEINLTEGSEKANEILGKYLKNHFSLSLGGVRNKLEFIGFEIEDDAIWCYLESTSILKVESVEVRNTILLDEFSDQQNILHLKFPEGKKSFILKSGKVEADYTF